MSKGKKRIIIIFLLSLAALILMSYQHNRKPFAFLRALTYPFDLLNNLTANIKITFSETIHAFSENKRLREELAAALLEQQQYSEMLQENKRLKEILALKERLPNYVTTAKAIARGYDRLLRTIVIDKGKNSGIRKDMTVITTKGLAGKVYSVRDNFSEVLLLRDTRFSVAVRLKSSRHEGIISGTGYDYCLLKYISSEKHVEKGEVAITSGLDGIFPPGLPVGIVSHAKKEGTEFLVLPFQPDTKIEEVVIVSRL